MDIRPADLITGLVRGLAVLNSFDTERQRLNATQAAERAGITRAAARRHLLTLAHLGYLDTDGQHYWLSPKVLRFSGSYLSGARLPRVVQPTLNRLALQTRQPCSVAVLDGDAVVIVARSVTPAADGVESGADGLAWPVRQLVAHGLHLGARLPAHATSTGRVLLAALEAPDFEHWLQSHPLTRLTPQTVVEPEHLRDRVAAVRRTDHAVVREEHEWGVHAIAVPLRDARGRTVAAMNAVLPTEHIDSGWALKVMWPCLQSAAQALQPLL